MLKWQVKCFSYNNGYARMMKSFQPCSLQSIKVYATVFVLGLSVFVLSWVNMCFCKTTNSFIGLKKLQQC